MLRLQGNYWFQILIMTSQLLPHFTIEYRKHFTNFHATVVEATGGIQIGATEALIIMYGLQWGFGSLSKTNESALNEIKFNKLMPFLPFELTVTVG